MLTRVLPGGFAMVAALAVPEFSVGAGDLGGGEGFDDPREPASVRKATRARPQDPTLSPALAGMRPVPALDLGTAGASAVVAPRKAVQSLAEAGPAPAGEVTIASLPELMPAPSVVPARPAPPVAASPVTATSAAATPSASVLAERAARPSMPAPAANAVRLSVPAKPLAPGRSKVEQRTAAPSQPAVAPPSLAAPVPVRAAPAAAAAAAAAAPAAPAVAAAPRPNPAIAAAVVPAARYPAGIDIASRLTTRVDGMAAGAVEFQQTATGLKVRVGSIVEVLAERYDADQLARIRASAAGNAYLSLAELQASGIPISYDPVYDEFNIGLTDTRPTAARKVHMDQISAPERGIGATGMEQLRP
jgi:hypothetical protein